MKLFQLYKTGGYARWVLPFIKEGDNILYFYGFRSGDKNYKKISIEAENVYDFGVEFKEKDVLSIDEILEEEKRNIIKFWFGRYDDIVDYLER